MVSIIIRSCVVFVVITACGKVEHGQLRAVQDDSRVLGLVANDDGTYEFKLCDKLDAYPTEVLADTSKCINPLMNADGSAKVFGEIPATPSTIGVRLRDGAIALVIAAGVGAMSYGVARYLIKSKVIRELAREKYVVGLEDSFNATLKKFPNGKGDDMAKNWQEKSIMVETDGSWQIKPELREHILNGNKLKKFNKVEDIENKLMDLDTELTSGERYTARIAEGLEGMAEEVKGKNPDQSLPNDMTEEQWKATFEFLGIGDIRRAPQNRLQQLLEQQMVFDNVRIYLEENRRLTEIELPSKVKSYLRGMTLPRYLKQLDDDTRKFFTKKVAGSDDNLDLLTSEELVRRRKNLTAVLEGLEKFEVSTLDNDGGVRVIKAVKEIKELIEQYPVVDNRLEITKILNNAKGEMSDVGGEGGSRLVSNEQELAGLASTIKGDLKRVRKRFRERVKSTTAGSPENIISGNEASIRKIVNNTGNVKNYNKRLLAGINDDGDKSIEHQKSLGDRIKGIFNYRHDELVVDKDEVVKDLVSGKDTIVNIKRGTDKFIGHLTGLLTFAGVMSTPEGQRRLPGNKKIAVAKRWHDLTGSDYSLSSATQVNNLRQLIDGLAKVSGTRVSPEVFYFLLRNDS